MTPEKVVKNNYIALRLENLRPCKKKANAFQGCVLFYDEI